MSLINQMLRDLDDRRGSAGNAPVVTFHGVGPVRPQHAVRPRGFAVAAWALLAAALLALTGLQADGNDPEHLSGTGWAPLALPEPAPRLRSTGHPSPRLPGNSGPVQTVKASEHVAPAVPVKADSGSAATVITEQKQQAAAPVVASAALEPTVVQPPQPVRNRSPEQSAEQNFAQAQRALAEQNWHDAENLLEQTLKVLPAHVEARTQLASLLVARQANDAAEQLLGEGLAIYPQAGALAKPYAQLLAERGTLQTALQVLANVHPDAETEALRAAVLHRMGNHAEAAGAYENALREQPEQALWWTGLAIAREHNREPREALQAYQRAARLQVSGTVRQYVEQRMQALQNMEGG
jgi:predicted Zn-dependent protease